MDPNTPLDYKDAQAAATSSVTGTIHPRVKSQSWDLGHESTQQPSNSATEKLSQRPSRKRFLRWGTDTSQHSSNVIQHAGPPASTDALASQSQQSRLDQARSRAQKWDHKRLLDEYVRTYARRMSLKEDFDALAIKNTMLEEQLSQQDLDIRKAQESAFALMAAEVSRAEDDETVRSKLKAVRGQWKIFAKEWATINFESKDRPVVSQLIDSLTASKEAEVSREIMAPANRGKAPAILLNALLARFLGQYVIKRPFISAFGLEPPLTGSDESPQLTMATLEQIYKTSMKGNPTAAHLWRSKTTELLDLKDHATSNPPSKTNDRRDEYYRMLVEEFIFTGYAKILFRPCSQDEVTIRKEQLLDVFRFTGETIRKLWYQKVYITTLGPEDLLHERYDINNAKMEPHATHRLEAGDTSMDGMPIQLVVEPGIIAWGNERGESYNRGKIWLKAVVWLSSGAHASS